jgi:GT2 family glycosyltransferase
VQAIRGAGDTCRIIVVDDGIDHNEIRWGWSRLDPVCVQGVKPFVFARNINIGIRSAGDDDVILLNDDALLRTPGGFTQLHEYTRKANAALASHGTPGYGIVAATTNNVGNQNQRQRGATCVAMRHESRMLCFVCVLIQRAVIDAVGLLDERFGGIDDQGREIYGFCDDDYSFRVRHAGYQLGIFDGCFVDHQHLESSFRPSGKTRSLDPGQRQFILKHGVDNWGKKRETSSWKHLFPSVK